MGFNNGGSSSGSLSSNTDVAFNNVKNKQQLQYDAATQKWLNAPDEQLVFNVQEYGALGDGGTDDTAAIMAAITAALATNGNRYGGVVYFPPSYSSYRYTQLIISADSNAQITLRGAGNASLRPIANSETDALGPSIIIKPLTTPTAIGAGYMKHVKIEHLTITGSGNPYALSRTNPADTNPYSAVRSREAIRIEYVQDLVMRDVYVSHFKIGLHTKDMFDSTLDNVQFLTTGYSIDDTDVSGEANSNFNIGYGYSLWLDEGLDHSNANKITNCHFEGGPLFVRFSGGSRQNFFTSGTKFENRTTAADDGSSRSCIWAEDIIENHFVGVMMTEDYTRGKPFIRIDSPTTMEEWVEANNTRPRLIFSNCHIQSNSTSKIQVMYGTWATFGDCKFDRVDGSSSVYPFVINGGYVNIHDSQITFADGGRNLMNVNGRHVLLHHLNIIGKTETVTGTLFKIGESATDGNIAAIVTNGTMGSMFTSISTDFGTFTIDIYGSMMKPKPINTSITSVSGISLLRLVDTAATDLTYFSQGHQNKRITVFATNTNTRLVHDATKLKLKSLTSRTVATNEAIEFINDAGVWIEV